MIKTNILTVLSDYGAEDIDTFFGRNVKLPIGDLSKIVGKSPVVWLGDIEPSVRPVPGSDLTKGYMGPEYNFTEEYSPMRDCPSLAYPPPTDEFYWPVPDFRSMSNRAVKSVDDDK